MCQAKCTTHKSRTRVSIAVRNPKGGRYPCESRMHKIFNARPSARNLSFLLPQTRSQFAEYSGFTHDGLPLLARNLAPNRDINATTGTETKKVIMPWAANVQVQPWANCHGDMKNYCLPIRKISASYHPAGLFSCAYRANKGAQIK